MKWKQSLLLRLTLVLVAAVWFSYEFCYPRSVVSRAIRYWHGEYLFEQKANDLAMDLRRIPSLRQIQPWAVQTIRRFENAQLRTNGGSTLFWSRSATTLSPEEMPPFIRKTIGERDKWGKVWPDILIVPESQPYLVLRYGDYGIAVGGTGYVINFGPQWSNKVAPGLYTYAIEQ